MSTSTTAARSSVERAGAVIDVRPEFPAFYARAHSQVARALGVTLRDHDLGTEAADEAMARCYAHWPTVRDYDNPEGWVYRVGLNWALSLRRRLARRMPHHQPAATPAPTIADPRIHDALGELDVKLRAVVVCRYLLDWSTDATAAALGIRPGTVKSRLHRALQQLERKLGDLR